MVVEIIVNGTKHTYSGDYDSLHNNDWDEVVREQLDEAHYQKINESSYADSRIAA